MLSEFTGAADQLTQSVLVNPHDIDGMKVKIMEAVNMDEAEQAKRMKRMNHHLEKFDVTGWSDRFLSELADINSKSVPTKENVART